MMAPTPGGSVAAEWAPKDWVRAMQAPILTLITDASLNDKTRACAWAAWAKFDGEDQLWCGPFKIEANAGICHAELCAIGNGIDRALKWFKPQSGTLLVIRSDSLTAINWLIGNGRPKSPLSRDAVAKIREMLTERGAGIRCRHVRAHQSGDGVKPAGYINNKVDEAAKAARRRIEDERRYGPMAGVL